MKSIKEPLKLIAFTWQFCWPAKLNVTKEKAQIIARKEPPLKEHCCRKNVLLPKPLNRSITSRKHIKRKSVGTLMLYWQFCPRDIVTQGKFCPKNNFLSKGQFAQDTICLRDNVPKGWFAQGTICPRENCPWDDFSQGTICQGTICPRDNLLKRQFPHWTILKFLIHTLSFRFERYSFSGFLGYYACSVQANQSHAKPLWWRTACVN